MSDTIEFTPDFSPKENASTIKVIGVGGAGSNAVQHMYLEGIKGVDFLICNTDACHLEACQIQEKLLIGNGLGAGGDAKVAGEFASKSEDKIKEFIGEKTKMLFIAAGMGKGTGTGASPVIAKVAKEMGILTIGVVTEPFRLEGKRRIESAKEGIEEMSKYVDSLIVINNQNLMKYFADLDIDQAYVQVDDILKNSVKSIAEIITATYKQNVDFEDVKATMKNSGKALLGTATASGSDRVQKVLEDVLNCPLLENQDISNAKNFLFFITYGPQKKLTMAELELLEIEFEKMQSENVHLIWGHGQDETLGDSIKLSVVVTNFSAKSSEETGKETTIFDKDNGTIEITIEEHPQGDLKVPESFSVEEKVKEPVVEPAAQFGNDDQSYMFDNSGLIDNVQDQNVIAGPTVIENKSGKDLEDDDLFNQTIASPAFVRDDVFLDSVLENRKTETFTAEPEPIYEFQDDASDVFHGFAD